MESTSLRGATLDRLPVELHTIVLEFLKPDKRSLLSCSLLSKEWRAMSLPFIFASINAKSNTNFNGLFSFLVDNPHLAKFVKSMSFQRKLERTRHFVARAGLNLMMITNDKTPSFDCTSLVNALPSLTALQQLVFENVRPHRCSSLRAPARPFTLQRLGLYDHKSTLNLLPLLLSVVTVDTVQFGRLALRDGVSPFARIERRFTLVIPKLVLAYTATGLLGPLRTIVHRDSLRSLAVAIESPEHFDLLCSFLREIGGSIASLDIDLTHLVHASTRFQGSPLVRWANLGEALPACLALEVLRIVVPVKQPTDIHATFADPEHDPRLSLFRGIFNPMRSQPREVTVRLDCNRFALSRKPAFTDGQRLEIWDLRALDAVLPLPGTKTIIGQEAQEVSLTVELGIAEGRHADVQALQEAIAQALPDCAVNALLCVRVVHG